MRDIDYSKFKKVKQDGKTVTLKHPDGHLIRIAISGLSQSLRKELDKMPLHQAEPEIPIPEPTANASPEPSAPVPEVAQPEEKTKESPKKTEKEVQDEQLLSDQAASPAPAPPPQEAASPASPELPADQTMPADQTAQQPIGPTPPAQDALQRTANNMAFRDDLDKGFIKPKTYEDILWKDKSVPQKILNFFGLMMSGAGAGLTHQPNMLLQMIDKTIANDMEAQKTDQSNRQNWYKMAVEHERYKSENDLTNAQAEAARTGNYQKLLELQRTQYQNDQLGIPRMQAAQDALHTNVMASDQLIQDHINSMADGPAKISSQVELDKMKAKHAQDFAANNLAFAGKAAVMRAANPIKEKPGEIIPGITPQFVDQNRLNAAIQKGRLQASLPNPIFSKDAIPPADADKVRAELKDLQTNRNNAQAVHDSIEKLSTLPEAGQETFRHAIAKVASAIPGGLGTGAAHLIEDPQAGFQRQRAIQKEALKNRIGGDMSAEDKEKMIDAMLPNYSDYERKGGLNEVHEKAMEHFRLNKTESTPTLDTYPGLKKSFPKYIFKAPKGAE
jgi:hypothetical protein